MNENQTTDSLRAAYAPEQKRVEREVTRSRHGIEWDSRILLSSGGVYCRTI